MHGRKIDSLALDNYQRAARVILANHLVTRTYPDRIALPLIRRWATELREDLAELFGYRLEVTETTARVFPIIDRLDAGKPARTPADRLFDRRRYAYLALSIAALGRAGDQITLSELADQVGAYAGRVEGLELSTDRAADRDAFVDAVGWLTHRGALTLADGDAGGWASDPEAGEALYDIDRPVVFALFRPPRALQHLHSVRGLLTEEAAGATGHAHAPTAADLARRVRRTLVERPVVYLDDLAPAERPVLGQDRIVADVELFTGLRAERRAEGVALIDTSGRLSDIRFPSTGTLAQVGLLLAGEIADRVLDIDNPLERRTGGPDAGEALAAQLDGAIPESTVFAPLADLRALDDFGTQPDSAFDAEAEEPIEMTYPLIDSSWVHETMQALADRYGATFAAQWQADVPGLTTEVVALLERLRLVRTVEDGLLVLPALARYRGAVVTVRTKRTEELFVTAADTYAGGRQSAEPTGWGNIAPDSTGTEGN
ncbi:TIGR02678 family protein [Nocardia sp. NBC_01499]|uniref:TIGR02678 family protein n=1 Tax=Nocardia sp. NBC_01499 TaxID=2903597 RepID=UPI003865AD9A